jgi:APA family basic amino acid/polyamine antiporter
VLSGPVVKNKRISRRTGVEKQQKERQNPLPYIHDMPSSKLGRKIGLLPAVSIVVGGIIGSAIFMKPSTMAGQLGSPGLLILVWVVAGLFSLFGAMVFADLGTLYPETGGQYVYLKKAFGEKTAFLYGWASMAVINSAAIAAIAFVMASYAGHFIDLPRLDPATETRWSFHIPGIGTIMPLREIGVKALAVSVILTLTCINYLSFRTGNLLQVFATGIKMTVIVLLVFGILLSGKGDARHFTEAHDTSGLQGWALLTSFMAAMTGAFAAYDGWNNLNMVAGEVRNPERNIGRSLVGGILICIATYTLVTLAYLYALPVGTMASSPLVARDAVAAVAGDAGASVVAAMIAASTFGATQVNLMANSRVVYAMSEAGQFIPWAAKTHPRHGTPANAVLLLGVWSCVLVMSGSFDILSDMFIFMGWVFYGLTVAGLFRIRRRTAEGTRPTRKWGYPWIPAIFLIFTLIYISTTLYSDIDNYLSGRSPIVNSVFGMALTLIGIPLQWILRTRMNGIQGGGNDVGNGPVAG